MLNVFIFSGAKTDFPPKMPVWHLKPRLCRKNTCSFCMFLAMVQKHWVLNPIFFNALVLRSSVANGSGVIFKLDPIFLNALQLRSSFSNGSGDGQKILGLEPNVFQRIAVSFIRCQWFRGYLQFGSNVFQHIAASLSSCQWFHKIVGGKHRNWSLGRCRCSCHAHTHVGGIVCILFVASPVNFVYSRWLLHRWAPPQCTTGPTL